MPPFPAPGSRTSAHARARAAVTPAGLTLAGTPVPQDGTKVAKTASHDIFLSTSSDLGFLPDLQFKLRTIADPGAKQPLIAVPAAQLAAIQTAAAFKALIADLQNAHKAFLNPEREALFASLPESDRSQYAFNSIRGRRIDQFVDELGQALAASGLRDAEAAEARRAINLAATDAFRSPEAVRFDTADTGTYWPFWLGSFVEVFETLRDSLPETDSRRVPLQNQIDYIFRKEYAHDPSVDERDIEKTLHLVCIDKDSRHVASMTTASDDSMRPSYEVLRLRDPLNDGKYVFRDGDKYYLEGTRSEITPAEVENLIHQPVQAVVFRRPTALTELRTNFRYDWNDNNVIDGNTIDTSWYGHCDIKAMIEDLLADMSQSGGVVEYNANSKQFPSTFSRDRQLEALAALLDCNAYYQTEGGVGGTYFGDYTFAGSRFDGRPSPMALDLDGGQRLDLNIFIRTLSKKGDATQAEDLDKVFSMKVPDEQLQSFQPNPDILRVQDGDVVILDATGRKLDATTEGDTFYPNGSPGSAQAHFVIDPTSTSGEKVLIGSQILDPETRTVTRYYYDPASKGVSSVPARFELDATTQHYVATEGTPVALGRLRRMTLGQEVKAGDGAADKEKLLLDAIQTGRKIATDSDPGLEVWNGQVDGITMTTEYRSPDCEWERVGNQVSATFGSGIQGAFINRLGPDGKIADVCEPKASVDFYWRETPRIAPVIRDRGTTYLNQTMIERGIVPLTGDRGAAIAAIRDLMDLIYLGLTATKEHPTAYTIARSGERLVYPDAATWRADIAKLMGLKADAINETKTVNLDIREDGGTGLTDTISITSDVPVKNLCVPVNITGGYGLEVSLTAPDGTKVQLQAKDFFLGSKGLNGTFGIDLKPAGDLAILNGRSAKGEWKLITNTSGPWQLVSWGLQSDK